MHGVVVIRWHAVSGFSELGEPSLHRSQHGLATHAIHTAPLSVSKDVAVLCPALPP